LIDNADTSYENLKVRFQRNIGALLFAGIILCVHPENALGHVDADESIDGYSKRLLRTPEDPDLLFKRQFLLRDVGRFQAALLDLGRIGVIAPDHPLLPLELGLTYTAMNNYVKALEHLTIYLKRPDNESSKHARAVGYSARAKAYERQNQPEKALADYRASLEIWMHQDTLFACGRLLEKLRRFDEASAIFRDGLAKLKDSAALRISLVRSLRAQEKFSEAILVVNPLIEQARMPAQWLLLRAELHAANGKANAATQDRNVAMEAINKVLRKRDTGQIRLLRARAWIGMGKPREARKDLLLALDRAPKLVEARRLLDSINLKMPAGGDP
jgi:tetratricopeptide (TPR) repeat protein